MAFSSYPAPEVVMERELGSSAYRCGTVAIVGRPNVGKSTLLNRFLGQKIAIVSPKPETTRDRILGILTLHEAQILFVDTPGIYRGAKTLLARHQMKAARQGLAEADLVLLLSDASAGWTRNDQEIVELLPRKKEVPTKGRRAAFLAINKVDRIEKGLILPQIEQASLAYPFRDIFPISATKGDNVESLLAALKEALPQGPALYPPDQVTDRPLRLLAQELIREKALLFTHEEIPHAVAVLIEEWRPGQTSTRYRDASVPGAESGSGSAPAGKTFIRATLYVERDSQKRIVIGKRGSLLKRIGEAARREIERLLEGPVYLDVWVKVEKDWRKDPQSLKRLGYG